MSELLPLVMIFALHFGLVAATRIKTATTEANTSQKGDPA